MVSMIVGGKCGIAPPKAEPHQGLSVTFRTLMEHVEITRFFDEEALSHGLKPIVKMRIMYIMEN